MGAKFSLPLDVQEIEQLSSETGFSARQLNEFHARFSQLSRNGRRLARDDLLRLPELRQNPLCDRILHAFFSDDDEAIDFADYARRLAVFRRSHHDDDHRDDKIRFLYDMIDVNRDGSITVAELTAFLTELIGDTMPPEQVSSIALRCMSEADEDDDHQIDFEEFKKTLKAVEIEQKMSISALSRR